MKLVKESISFTRNEDPIKNLGVGRIVLIEQWLKKYDIKNYGLDFNNEIISHQKIDLSFKNLTKLPEYIKFQIVYGDFFIYNNKLESLIGCPDVVKGKFNCSYNNLINLLGAPEKIYEWFDCSHNKLISLEGIPKSMDSFACNDNNKKFSKEEIIKKWKNYDPQINNIYN